jgi:hypothetical protein
MLTGEGVEIVWIPLASASRSSAACRRNRSSASVDGLDSSANDSEVVMILDCRGVGELRADEVAEDDSR